MRRRPRAAAERALERRNEEKEISDESIFDLFRGRGDADRQVAVNRYLWQASLDTLSFLPVERADPFSGLIVTGWGSVRRRRRSGSRSTSPTRRSTPAR